MSKLFQHTTSSGTVLKYFNWGLFAWINHHGISVSWLRTQSPKTTNDHAGAQEALSSVAAAPCPATVVQYRMSWISLLIWLKVTPEKYFQLFKEIHHNNALNS